MIAPTDTINVRTLLTDPATFGPEDIKHLRAAISQGQTGEIRQQLYELEHKAETGGGPTTVLAAGIVNHLLARHDSAARYLSQLKNNGIASYYLGESLLANGQCEEAAAKFADAAKHGYDAVQATLSRAGAVRQCGRLDEAEQIVRSTGREGATRAEYSYQMGCILADRGDTFGAIEYFERSADMDPYHTKALFRLAAINDLVGNDDDAIKLYERALSRPPFHLGALINLGLLYEDKENYRAAEFCFRRVLEAQPTHQRARLYMRDIEATGNMYYDEEELRRRSEIEQLMRIPVADFELSARARNCLDRAGIKTLGDLTKVSEADLLAGKNFGETSLKEINELMQVRGLRIGQFAEMPTTAAVRPYQPEAVTPQERVILDTPVSELNLSVRSRKCLAKLGISSIGELLSRTPDDLLSIRNFGVTSLNEIREKLGERGLKLRGD